MVEANSETAILLNLETDDITMSPSITEVLDFLDQHQVEFCGASAFTSGKNAEENKQPKFKVEFDSQEEV
jgi:hypothetical protein